ncbi:hypothetical protein MUP46_03085 [Patescibacteria group bacterium]|nr:hypothetical protein [Patescibacteria group bacterium]
MKRLNQSLETPFSVLFSIDARGLIPITRIAQLDPTGQDYYFQMDSGKVCLTRYTPRPDPNTEPQQAQRNKLVEANDAWSTLSPEAQESYRYHPLAKEKSLPPRQTFLSLFMRGKI